MVETVKSDMVQADKSNMVETDKSDMVETVKSDMVKTVKSDMVKTDKSDMVKTVKSDMVQADKSNMVETDKTHMVKTVKCDGCGKSFSKKANLKKHMMNCDQSAGPFQCPDCEKSFTYESDLERHVDWHKNGPELFRCDREKCEQSFKQKNRLQRHIRLVHDKVKDFWCVKCKKGFVWNRQLKRHKNECLTEEEKQTEIVNQILDMEEEAQIKLLKKLEKKFNNKLKKVK